MKVCVICRCVFLDSIGDDDICHHCQKRPNRTFYMVLTNCDCASGQKIMTYHPSRNIFGRTKCPYCEKLLGDMQYGPITIIRARSYIEAYNKFQGKTR